MASIITSVMYISWSIASYQRALRRSVDTKRTLTALGILLQWIWRSLTISTRLISIGLFVSVFNYWICPIAIGHWGVMTVWIMHQGTSFCSNEHAEYVFNAIIGLIYLITFINIKDEPTRLKYTSYYTIVLLENIALTSLWYIRITSFTPHHSHLAQLLIYVGLICAFLCGIFFMMIYYRFAHPNGKLMWINKAARCC